MKGWLQSLPLSKKLILGFLLAGLVPMSILAAVSMTNANRSIETQVSNQLQAVRDLKAHEITRYFETLRNQAATLATDPAVIEAATQLPVAFREYASDAQLAHTEIVALRRELEQYYRDGFGAEYRRQNSGLNVDMTNELNRLDDASIVMQHSYISANANPLGSKHLLDTAGADTRYNRLHLRLHAMLRPYVEKFGFYDVFIVEASTGMVVYSTFKEVDFATSLKDGAYANTSIGEAYRKGLQLSAGGTTLVDFRNYRPSYDAPASFVATPITADNKTVALLMLQIPISRINAIMTDRSGMGQTGETYIVGPDHLMRSDSFLEPRFHTVVNSFRNPDKGQVNTQATALAFKGNAAVEELLDYNGNPVVSAYTGIDLGDFQWALLAEQDVAEAFAPARALLRSTIINAALCSIALSVLGWLFSRLIADPVHEVARVLTNVGHSGNFSLRAKVTSTDEVGKMATAFNDFIGVLGSAFQQINQVLEAVGKGSFDAKVRSEFNGDIASLAAGVNTTISKINEFQVEQKLANEKLQQSTLEIESRARESAELACTARSEAEKANRVKQALDVASTCVMMADADNTIIYTNYALSSMMRDVESDIRKVLPQFSADALVGTNMDTFHRTPTHQRSILAGMNGTYETQIKVGPRTFRLIANPILHDSKRIGTVVEWNDRTAELHVEAEIDQLVEAASNGDFRKQLDLTGQKGFFLSLGRKLNSMVEITRNALTDVTRVMEKVAQGDLTHTVEKNYVGLFGQLKDDVNNTISRLQEVISNIVESANTVSRGAAEIAHGMNDLSTRTEQQAASLEETAASMNEMTSSVKNSSNTAHKVADLSTQAEQRASEGGEVVRQAMVSMQSISDASKRIADIIGVVDEIAFQTNLLALNAAVEAARAGEQGRGFAVVAAEVRNLAQRSGQAAREIKSLINDSLEKVEGGRVLVNQSGATLASIVKAVEEVRIMVQDMAQSSGEQANGISQVNLAVADMDTMTQQNSALVEEVNAAGSSMSEQAELMASELSFFVVKT